MSIELFLLANLAAEATLLGAVARAMGRFDGRRLLAASLLSAALSVPAAMQPTPCARLMTIPAAPLILLIGRASPAVHIKAALLLAGGAMLSGGLSLLPPFAAHGPLGALCGMLGGCLLSLMCAARSPIRGDWQVRLALTANGHTARFAALIDTGNRLREPLSGQPVLIAEAALLRRVLPETGWRELRYGAVGGGGRMACFKPARIEIERGGRRTRAPDVWVAVAPAPLPGEARALAPSEFSAYAR